MEPIVGDRELGRKALEQLPGVFYVRICPGYVLDLRQHQESAAQSQPRADHQNSFGLRVLAEHSRRGPAGFLLAGQSLAHAAFPHGDPLAAVLAVEILALGRLKGAAESLAGQQLAPLGSLHRTREGSIIAGQQNPCGEGSHQRRDNERDPPAVGETGEKDRDRESHDKEQGNPSHGHVPGQEGRHRQAAREAADGFEDVHT